MSVVVVGGGSGVGLALAGLLASSEERVVILDRSRVQSDPERGIEFVELELTDSESIRNAADSLPKDPSSIALVAARADRGAPGDTLRTNYLGLRQFMGALPSGLSLLSVVATSSISASTVGTDPETLAEMLETPEAIEWDDFADRLSPWEEYQLSKWLVREWALSLAASHVKTGQRSNVVSPGAIDTPLLASLSQITPPKMLRRGVDVVARHASALEVAAVIRFLLGPEASWVNGVDVRIDGGLMNYYERRRGSSTQRSTGTRGSS